MESEIFGTLKNQINERKNISVQIGIDNKTAGLTISQQNDNDQWEKLIMVNLGAPMGFFKSVKERLSHLEYGLLEELTNDLEERPDYSNRVEDIKSELRNMVSNIEAIEDYVCELEKEC